jgi:hypothetical protein
VQSQAALLQYPSIVVSFDVGGGSSILSCHSTCRRWHCHVFVTFESTGRVRYTFVSFETAVFIPRPRVVRHAGVGLLLHVVRFWRWASRVVRQGSVGSSCRPRHRGWALVRRVVAPSCRPRCWGWAVVMRIVREVGGTCCRRVVCVAAVRYVFSMGRMCGCRRVPVVDGAYAWREGRK